MGFVYEPVGEENKELWESIGFRDWGLEPFAYRKIRRWCIDVENKCYFQPIGGGMHELPYYYDLCFGGIIVRIETFGQRNYGPDEGEWNMSIDVVRIPKTLELDFVDVKKAMVKAFRAYYQIKDTESFSVSVQKIEYQEVDYNGN